MFYGTIQGSGSSVSRLLSLTPVGLTHGRGDPVHRSRHRSRRSSRVEKNSPRYSVTCDGILRRGLQVFTDG